MERIIAQVDCLRVLLGLHAAPRLAPQPFLRQTVNGHLILNKVRKVLIQIR